MLSVLSHSGCHHLSLYFTVLWTWAGLELSVSPRSAFGNISQRFIYNLCARPVPHCGRWICYREYAMTHAYHLTDFKGKGVNMVTSAAFSLSQLVKMIHSFLKKNVNLMIHCFIDFFSLTVFMGNRVKTRQGENTMFLNSLKSSTIISCIFIYREISKMNLFKPLGLKWKDDDETQSTRPSCSRHLLRDGPVNLIKCWLWNFMFKIS